MSIKSNLLTLILFSLFFIQYTRFKYSIKYDYKKSDYYIYLFRNQYNNSFFNTCYLFKFNHIN